MLHHGYFYQYTPQGQWMFPFPMLHIFTVYYIQWNNLELIGLLTNCKNWQRWTVPFVQDRNKAWNWNEQYRGTAKSKDHMLSTPLTATWPLKSNDLEHDDILIRKKNCLSFLPVYLRPVFWADVQAKFLNGRRAARKALLARSPYVKEYVTTFAFTKEHRWAVPWRNTGGKTGTNQLFVRLHEYNRQRNESKQIGQRHSAVVCRAVVDSAWLHYRAHARSIHPALKYSYQNRQCNKDLQHNQIISAKILKPWFFRRLQMSLY